MICTHDDEVQYIALMLSQIPSRVFHTAQHAFSISRCEVCGVWPSDTPFAVCQACLNRYIPTQPRCLTCGLGDVFFDHNGVCDVCRQYPPLIERCIVAVNYAAPWDQLMQRFKFRQEIGWARLWSDMLYERLSAATQQQQLLPTEWVIPVPLHTQSLSQRGYNQSWLLCQALQKRCQDRPIQQELKWQFRHDVLLKTAFTPQQHRLTRTQRQHNLETAFAVSAHAWTSLQGRSVALVDDILTTGSTLDAAAKALRQQGAAHVQAWVVARTPLKNE